MKRVYFFLGFLFLTVALYALPGQQDSSVLKKDTTVMVKDSVPPGDSFPLNKESYLTQMDSVQAKKDSVFNSFAASYRTTIQDALQESRFLNAGASPVAVSVKERQVLPVSVVFYILLGIVILLAFLRFFYTRYFNNLFRVFFNTSLRQSQLTDQLLQAKQVSLFFNILFVVSSGLYVYCLLDFFDKINPGNPLLLTGICSLAVAVIYFLKYIILKFSGWITGYTEAANTYLFIIFLINKILGILLLPFIIVIAFAAPFLRYPAVLISLLLIGLMFLFRFLRSYGLLQKELKVSRMHFFMYIVGIELIPLLLIYKGVMILLNKNL